MGCRRKHIACSWKRDGELKRLSDEDLQPELAGPSKNYCPSNIVEANQLALLLLHSIKPASTLIYYNAVLSGCG